jgi:hypothetical protein
MMTTLPRGCSCKISPSQSTNWSGGGESDGSLASTIHTSSDIFFHEIGELELMAEVRTEAVALDKNQAEHQAHEHEARQKAVAAARGAQLETFMCAHPALFPMTPQPRGRTRILPGGRGRRRRRVERDEARG